VQKPYKPSNVDVKKPSAKENIPYKPSNVDVKKPSTKENIPPPKKKQSDLQLPWGTLGVLAVVVAILAAVVYSRPPHTYNKSAPKVQTTQIKTQTQQDTQMKTQTRQDTQMKTQQIAEETVATSAAGNISKLGSSIVSRASFLLLFSLFFSFRSTERS
jgi:hypothetical protein